MRPLRKIAAVSNPAVNAGTPTAAAPAIEDFSSARRVSFVMKFSEMRTDAGTENPEPEARSPKLEATLLPPFLQHRHTIARSRQHFIKRGVLPQVLQQRIVQ